MLPNPVAEGDRGEYVLVRRPPGAGWTLSDGEATVELPEVPAGTIAVTRDPAAVPPGLDAPAVPAPPRFRLANAGETLVLARDGRVADRVRYRDAPEDEVLYPAKSSGAGGTGARNRDEHGADRSGREWRPRGATDRSPVTLGPTTVAAFVLPDAPGIPVSVLRSADRRLLLAGYTMASWRVARALAAAADRGIEVQVLVEGGPVGGITRRQATVLDWLVARNVSVRAVAGPRARYEFHHAKYAVADDRAVVTTENWKPAGTGGRSNRGWGVVVENGSVADRLAGLFRADAGWQDAVRWSEFRAGRRFEPGTAANGSYPSRFPPRRVRVDRVRVLAAPDNAEGEILEVVRSADSSLLVQQPTVGGRDQPFVRATLAAARRGVRVRVLLSGAWYVREDNRRIVRWLRGVAEREGLALEARVAEPRSRYGAIHAKGVVADERRAVVGSVNWNNHSARENREVALVLEGDAVGSYYARVLRSDWRGGTRRLPATVLAAVGFAGALAAVGVRRLRWR